MVRIKVFPLLVRLLVDSSNRKLFLICFFFLFTRGCSHNYQLDISDDKDKDTEKIERKSQDDNNNSENKSTNSKEPDLKEVNKYEGVGSDSERHFFTGRGARMKEPQMLGHDNNRDYFSRRSSNSMSDRSECEHFQKVDTHYNKNRGHRDYFDYRSNIDNRSNDDKKEYRNRNFQTFNQRGRFENHQHRFDNQNHFNRHDNHPQRCDNQAHRHENHPQRYDNQFHRLNNHPQGHDNQSQRHNNHPQGHDNQSQRHDNHPQRCDNQPHRHENHPLRYDNQPQRYNNHPPRYDNQLQRHDNQHQRYDNQHQRNDNKPQQYNNQHYRYDNQQRRYDNYRLGNNQRRDFPNRDKKQDSILHKEVSKDGDSNKLQGYKEHSAQECNKNNTLITQQPPEKEKEDQVKTPEIKPEVTPEVTPEVKPNQESINETLSSVRAPLAEDPSSLCFMQESFKEDEPCEIVVEDIDPESETASEPSEFQETLPVSTNPFFVGQFPIQVINPPAMMCQTSEGVSIHNGIFPPQSMSPHNKMPGTMTYSMINPFIAPAPIPPHFQPQHTHEIPPESGCSPVPIQSVDMRFFQQHPLVHNHSFMPITLPMGMPSCSNIPQMPIGNLPGVNFIHQHPVNCQQCPSHICQSQRIPLQNLNCQSPIYPQFANIMTPMGPVLMPITPASQEQIISQPGKHTQQGKNSRPDKGEITPATVIEKSANNLVNLCENIPSRRGSYPTSCPPGFEHIASPATPSANQRIICDTQQDTLPSFKNNPKEDVQESSRKSEKKIEEFTDEKLADIYCGIFNSTNLEKKEDEKICKWTKSSIKFSQDSYNEQLFKSYLYSEDNPLKSKDNAQAPRPGFRVGVGRGKKVGRTD